MCRCPTCLCSIICITAQQGAQVPVVLGYLQNAARHRQVVGGNGKEKKLTGEEGQVTGARVPQERAARARGKTGDAKRDAQAGGGR